MRWIAYDGCMGFSRQNFMYIAASALSVLMSAWMLVSPLSAAAQSSFYNPDAPPTADQPTGAAARAMDFGPDQVCLSLERCLEILDTHPPDSFDYGLLAGDFDRFGGAAQEALLARVFADIEDEAAADDANRALNILARQRGLLPPGGQRRMAALWTNFPADSGLNIDDLAAVLTRHLSPMVRSAAIEGTVNPNDETRAASQMLLARLAMSDLNMPLRPQDIKTLARAVRDFPHTGVVAILAKDKSAAVTPLLASALKSGDGPTTTLAYQALYARDREAAFRALVATLYNLGDDKVRPALALSEMLRVRHTNRDDGFYLSFARDLASDKEMSAMGRLAGFDALVRFGEAIEDNALSRDSYKRALSAYLGGYAKSRDIPRTYFDLLTQRSPKTIDAWLGPLSGAVGDNRAGRIQLVELSGHFDTNLARRIAIQAVRDDRDHRVLIAGLLARTAQSGGADKTALMQWARDLSRTHPMTRVRQSAVKAMEALSKPNPRAALAGAKTPSIVSLNKSTKFCKTTYDDFAASTRPMPYFDGGMLASGDPALRGWLRTAARIKGGWLAGYQNPQSGALLAYDNVTGAARNILPLGAPAAHHAVHAIIPFKDSQIGQMPGGFWVVVGRGDDAGIYRAMNTPRGLSVSFETTLPMTPDTISRAQDGGIVMGFGRANPPLHIGLDGRLTRRCDTGTRAKSPLLP